MRTPAYPPRSGGLALKGLPEGLAAIPLRDYREDASGTKVPVRTRRGLLKLDRVELVPAAQPEALSLHEADERFVLARGRRSWSTIEQRYGQRAREHTLALVRGGAVRLRCLVDDELRLGDPLGWVLTDEWTARRAARTASENGRREQWHSRAQAAAGAVTGQWPELAKTLLEARSRGRPFEVLVCAAEDLAEGASHDGPRGFSQAHFGDTKVADDVAAILRAAGVEEQACVALGVRRGTRLGVAGPIDVTVGADEVVLSRLAGPVLIRTDQPHLRLQLNRPAALVIVENLQAAEAVSGKHPGVGLVYTAGPLADSALDLLSVLAANATSVAVVPDADLGGVRIAEPLIGRLPHARLVDIGAWPHPDRTAWPTDGVSVRGLQAAVGGPAGELARACLERGYPVEQELATVRAVTEALR